MSEFDSILKQINEKIEKLNNKIQELSVKIIPLEEDREKLQTAKKGLEGNFNLKISTKAKVGSNIKDVILFIVKNSDKYMNSREIYEEVKKDHEYNESYVLTTITNLTREDIIVKDNYNKFRMREVGPVTKTEKTGYVHEYGLEGR